MTNGGLRSVNVKMLRLLLVALLALSMSFVAACGDDEEPSGGSGGEPASTAESGDGGEAIKVGMVTDIGGLNDRSFNESAYKGLKRAESELGV
jgi:basic membrane protein A